MDVILHIGAGQGGQLKEWLASGAQRIVLFEPHPELAERLRSACEESPNVRVVAAAIAAEEGMLPLNEFNLPEANSLRAPTALKQLFPGLKRISRHRVRTITPAQMAIKYGPADHETASLVIEAPGEAYAILQPLVESDLLDRFTELQVSMTVEPCYEGSAAAEQTLKVLRDYGFDVVSHDDRDPDWPHWVLHRNPLKIELKTLRHTLSQVRQERADAKQRADSLKKELVELQQARKSEQAKGKEQVESLQKQLAEQQAELQKWDQRYQKQQKALEQTEARLAEFKQYFHKRKAQALQLEKTVEELHRDQQERQSTQVALQKELNALKAELDDKNSSIATLNASLTDYQQRYTQGLLFPVRDVSQVDYQTARQWFANEGILTDTLRALESLRLRDIAFDEDQKAFQGKVEGLLRLKGGHQLPVREARPTLASSPHQVLYCLHQSVPHATNGYATRSHGVAMGLQQAGIKVCATTRPGFPWDAGVTGLNSPQHKVEIDNINYVAVEGSELVKTPLDRYLEEAAQHFAREARACGAGVILAASNHITALPALMAARRLGLPFVYEVRGLWEVTQASTQPAWADSEHYQVMRKLEQQTVNEADFVIALTDELADELSRWGVERERIEVVPNAVNAERFQPMAPDTATAGALDLTPGVPVIGYAGSAVVYEGLELLMEALAQLKQQACAFTFVLVGDGKVIESVKAKAKALGIEEECRFIGRVAFEEVPRYLSCMDIMPIPRLSSAVTEMVSALKPLEAMAMGKAVVLSDVSPHIPMAGPNGERARLFKKDSAAALSEALQQLIDSPEERERLGQAAKAWIERERTWNQVTQRYAEAVKRAQRQSEESLSPFKDRAAGASRLPKLKQVDPVLRKKLGIGGGDKVIGSFSAYEGLDVLLDACTELVQGGEKLKLLLVGDDQPLTLKKDSVASAADADIANTGLKDTPPWLIQVGRVPHEQVADYYALLDAVVIPRKPLAVCQLVPPIKAAEALAYGKRLVVSDVAPLAEYAQKHEGVVTFEAGNAQSLATALQGSLKLPAPQPSTELLFSAHTEPMVRVLKGEGSEFVGQPAPAEPPEPVAEATPLKRYTEQPTLSVVKDAKSGAPVPGKEDIVVAAGQHFEIRQEVVAGEEYSLSVTCIANRANPKGAVADITFLDGSGKPLPKPYLGMAKSKAFGAYFYVETQECVGAKPKTYTFTAPEKAANVAVKLVAFGVKPDMKLVGDYRLTSTKERIKESAEGSKYIESFEEILLEAEAIPDSNGSEYFTKHDFRVGVIGDVYMYNFYKDVFATVHYLSPSNYSDVLAQGLDIVIYTTCWKGINNEEWRGVKFREKPKKALDAILAYAKENNIKTVFQTIEDPSNFDYFLPVAEKFEYVLTTDTDCIERYKEELGHDRVFFGEYGVNPQFNNPIGCRRNTRNAAFFAGSYPKRYKERCEDMETIFDSIVDSGGELLIADRNFGADSEDLVYPARFQSSVLPPVQHAVLQKLHKLFRYNLNFNSIKQSPTMCAMRVYELQAQGNGFISNYANSVFNKFPGIRIVPFKQDMSFDFGKDETWEEYQINVSNIREVLNRKASYQVVSTLLSNIGLSSEAKRDTTISVICNKKTPAIVQAFEAQSYPDKVLLEEAELQRWDEVKEKHQIGYFCWFSEGNNYEKHYLSDLLNGFKYTNCRYITKNAYFNKQGRYVDGAQHEYTTQCSGKGLSLFSAQYLSPSELAPYGIDVGFEFDNGYSIDPFEVNFVAYIQRHSSKVTSFQLSVIVPVYNNGRFLVTKCIPSLQRNHLWPEMEILLVDDGSTDHKTLATLEYLEALYPNVRVKFNHDGGSGSASRPRNQGIDMASAPLVTFLDPDNEIAPGAYDLLMELYAEANQNSLELVEFVSGFHVKVGEEVKTIGKHTPKRLSIIKDFKNGYFDRGRFPVVATQSAVLSKEFLEKNAIRFVERSAGQDTLFGWELIANAKCGAFNGDAYIIYYADRSDSITNEVNKSYFEKKIILEREQKRFLEENGILESFVDSRFDQFMKDWYLKKLDHVANENRVECMEILRDICSIYQKDLNDYL